MNEGRNMLLELGSTLKDTDKQSEHGVFISRLRGQTTVMALHP